MNFFYYGRVDVVKKNLKWLKADLLFIGAGAGAGEKIPGAGQKWTGSATLPL